MGAAGDTMSLSVLILEDEPLIAIDIEDTLQSVGFQIAAVLNSCEAATEWLAERSPDVAILDINLKDGSCEVVAEKLVNRGVPFIVHTGTSPLGMDGHHSVFREGHWVGKPASPEDLIAAITASTSR